MVLDDLSNAQLARVFNAVTGQTVARFTNKPLGLTRVRRALDKTGMAIADALDMAGVRDETEEDEVVQSAPEPVDPMHQHCADLEASVDAAAPESQDEPLGGADLAAFANDDADGAQTVYRRDKYGFVHRKASKAKAKGERKAGGKLDIVLNLLRSNDGTTVPEIMEATGWLPHTTRAYLSKGGAAGKAVTIMSEKIERDGAKVTVYSAR